MRTGAIRFAIAPYAWVPARRARASLAGTAVAARGSAQIALRLEDRAEIGPGLGDGGKPRRPARIGANARDRRIGDLRPDVVGHKVRDAVAERARRYLHADRTAHRSADPAQRADLELV